MSASRREQQPESDQREEEEDAEAMTETLKDGEVTPESGTKEPEPSLPLDTLFSILSNERRRLTLQTLHQGDEVMERRELAESIAAVENGKARADVTPAERKRVYVSLHQHHLPKLEGADVITRDASRVSMGPNADTVVSYLPSVTDGGDDESSAAAPQPATRVERRYGPGVALSGVALAVGSLFGLGPPVVAAAVALTAVGLFLVWHERN